MGSPLGPSLANAFLCHFETVWLNECPSYFKPLFYRRYIDDTFLVFKSSDHVPLFLNYLNEKHPNIKFTSEIEADKSLPFLDVKVTRNDKGFETDLYRKPTFTGLTTKFSSFIPLSFKRNLVKTLTYRAFHICSNYFKLDEELRFIRKLLLNNGFPFKFTDTSIGKTLDKLLNNRNLNVQTVPRKLIYFSISYTGKHSLNLRNKLSKLLRQFYPQCLIRVIFKPEMTIHNLFRYKDMLPKDLASSVVYQYSCDSCKATYIGKTKRHLKTRIHEHKGRSVRTGKVVTTPLHSAIRDHSHEADHPIKDDNFSIIASSDSDMELLILESICQSVERPTLGGCESSTPLLCF